jgi:methyltransferase (TIGR00027 family)
MLGAGMDTFAYRQPEWANRLQIFELDHPASQSEKRAKLEAAQIPIPSNLGYVRADFEKDSLQAVLAHSNFHSSEPAFFSCLGVFMYLTEKESMLSWSLSPPCPDPVKSYLASQMKTSNQ